MASPVIGVINDGCLLKHCVLFFFREKARFNFDFEGTINVMKILTKTFLTAVSSNKGRLHQANQNDI